MNKLFYRVVFNKARGILMAVSELAKSATSAGSVLKTHRNKTGVSSAFTLSKLGFLTYVAFGFVQVANASSIVVDQGAHAFDKPTIVEQNGVVRVDILKPTAGGVSVNQYSQFDVSDKGVILNNASIDSQTTLAGQISGNANLVDGSARVIVNQVNSHKESLLNGQIEVAGQKAQVIISNPSGISCSGCGFVNANKATLTTGQVLVENGELAGYKVERGHIKMSGDKRIDFRDVDYTELLARTIEINQGTLAGKDIKVVTGRNDIDANVQTITKLVDDQESLNNPVNVALDVKALGGMFGNKIHLVSTESGVGVNNANLIAGRNELSISIDGKLTNIGDKANLMSEGSVKIVANVLENSGKIQTVKNKNNPVVVGDVALNVAGNIDNKGTISSTQNLKIISGGALSNDTLAGLYGEKDVNIQVASLDNKGYVHAKSGNLNVQAETGDIINSYCDDAPLGSDSYNCGKISSVDGNVNIEAAGQLINNKKISSDSGNVTIKAGNVINRYGITASNGDIKIVSKNDVVNEGMGEIVTTLDRITGGNSLSIQADGNVINKREIFTRNGDVNIMAKNILNEDTIASPFGKVILNASDTITNGKVIMSKDDLVIAADTVLNNALITNKQGVLSITAKKDIISKEIRGLGDAVNLVADNKVEVTDIAFAENTMNIRAHDLNNGNRIETMNGDLRLSLTNSFSNDNGGVLVSGANLNIASKGDISNKQLMSAEKGKLTLSGAAITNDGELKASEGFDIQATKSIVNNGKISGGKNLSLVTKKDSIVNAEKGQILMNGDVHFDSYSFINDGKLASENGNITGEARHILSYGDLRAAGNIGLKSSYRFYNEGLIHAGGDMNMEVRSIFDNSGKMGALGNVAMNVSTLTNYKGAQIVAGVKDNFRAAKNSNLTMNATSGLYNQGLMKADKVLLKAASRVNNYQGGVISGNDIAISTNTVNNFDATSLISAKNRVVVGARYLNQDRGATLYSAGDMAIGRDLKDDFSVAGRILRVENRGSSIEAQGNLLIKANIIENINNRIDYEDFDLGSSRSLVYRIPSEGRHYETNEVEDHGHWLRIKGGDWYYNFDRIIVDKSVSERRVVHSEHANILSGKSMTIEADALNNRNSKVLAGGLLTRTIKKVFNQDNGQSFRTVVRKERVEAQRVNMVWFIKQFTKVIAITKPKAITNKTAELGVIKQLQGSKIVKNKNVI